MKPFELFDLPLKGAHLIEASAGTGKTYTLAAIYLRLVVELGFRVDRLLVVTYTKAATEELKTRIRQRLVSAKNSWHHGQSADPMLDDIRRRLSDTGQALQRIQDALMEFDRAAIYTIHGFCQRVLQHYAFETGHLFQSEFVHSDAPFIQETAQDFWRRYFVRAPYELAYEAIKKIHDPTELAKILQFNRFPYIAVLSELQKPPLSAVTHWRETAKAIQAQWPQVRQQVKQLLQYDGLNGQIYGVLYNKKTPSAPPPRQVKVETLCRAMDQWNGNYPLFKSFELFSRHRLQVATKKGRTTPEHPFFKLCERALQLQDQMKDQLETYLRYLKARFYHDAQSTVSQKKARQNMLFFDDLLYLVHQAVKGSNGRLLANALRTQYPVALVDEFQDTDQLQSDIFYTLFATDQNLLVMIGDPKQAIYSFRGADLFSYLHASDAAQTRSTLSKNWRSNATLIDAVNTVFGSHPQPFGFKQICFDDAVAARPEKTESSPAFHLWYLTPDDDASPTARVPITVANRSIASAVAQEIVDLLEATDPTFVPEDIAVLVRTHRQAHRVKDALAARKVPAVLHSAGRIFDTVEAEHLAHIMAAVDMPSDPHLVKAALANKLFGWDASSLLDHVSKAHQAWQTQWESFGVYRKIWVQKGFYAMFRSMLIQEGIKIRILGQPDGERALTNLLHLAELIHQAEIEHRLGPEGLCKWLALQRQSNENDSDEQQLRLESDAHAVRIITMHKSKGLQFEVVFCPYSWSGIKKNDQTAVFHHPEKQDQLALALGPQIPKSFQVQAQIEGLSENLRMLYVALTRARRRCYWVWGPIKGADISAPAYLLHGLGLDICDSDGLRLLKDKMAGLRFDHWLREVLDLARRSNGSIEVEALIPGQHREYVPAGSSTAPLAYRSLTRRMDRRWRVSSFSAMIRGQIDEQSHRGDGLSTGTIELAKENGFTLFDFPKGTRAGLFFHDLLEHWDHTQYQAKRCKNLVVEKIQQHGYKSDWQEPVQNVLQVLAKIPLQAKHDRFCLHQVAHNARRNEIAFYLPLKDVCASQLQETFAQYGDYFQNQKMTEQMGRLKFAPAKGFIKGFIDVVFSHNGRTYLVDWKSNYLGSMYDDYTMECLGRAMNESYYFLQYHLYIVALDQLLRRRIDNYDYGRHFGGVFYIFLRGLNPEGDAATGVYYDLPDAQLVTALSQDLIADR